jgi:hypothetical protein
MTHSKGTFVVVGGIGEISVISSRHHARIAIFPMYASGLNRSGGPVPSLLRPEAMANAKLFAIAPKMLALLKRLAEVDALGEIRTEIQNTIFHAEGTL